MKIKRLEWEGNEKYSEAKIVGEHLMYAIDLTNMGLLRAPGASIRFEGYFEVITELDIGEDWTMDQCKEQCQSHFESFIKQYIEEDVTDDNHQSK